MKTVKRLLAALKRPARTVKAQAKHRPPSAVLLAILAARAVLHDQLDHSARNGSIADALPQILHANHLAELSEIRRQLAEEQQGYESCLRRLDGMFPEAEPPAPEPPPPPPQFFPRLGKLIGNPQPRAAGPFH